MRETIITCDRCKRRYEPGDVTNDGDHYWSYMAGGALAGQPVEFVGLGPAGWRARQGRDSEEGYGVQVTTNGADLCRSCIAAIIEGKEVEDDGTPTGRTIDVHSDKHSSRVSAAMRKEAEMRAAREAMDQELHVEEVDGGAVHDGD